MPDQMIAQELIIGDELCWEFAPVDESPCGEEGCGNWGLFIPSGDATEEEWYGSYYLWSAKSLDGTTQRLCHKHFADAVNAILEPEGVGL